MRTELIFKREKDFSFELQLIKRTSSLNWPLKIGMAFKKNRSLPFQSASGIFLIRHFMSLQCNHMLLERVRSTARGRAVPHCRAPASRIRYYQSWGPDYTLSLRQPGNGSREDRKSYRTRHTILLKSQILRSNCNYILEILLMPVHSIFFPLELLFLHNFINYYNLPQ